MRVPAYVREKAWVAMNCLAVSDAPLPERLADAWITALSRLKHPAPDWGEIPEDIAEIYQRIEARLDQPSPGRGTPGALAAAIALSQDEALDLARDIVHLHDVAGPQ